MKKLIIILLVILSTVMLVGIKYQRDSLYNPREIEKANKEMINQFSSLKNEEVVQATAENQVEEDLPPLIEILYPSIFNDGDTIESDKVELKFSDDSKVIKATMNNQEVSTEEILIASDGTYTIEIQDDTNKTTTLTFTLKTLDTVAKEQSTKVQAAKEQSAKAQAAKAQAAKAQAAKAQAAKEQAAKAQAARAQAEQAAKAQAEQAAKAQAEQIAREQAEQAAKEQAEKEQEQQNTNPEGEINN